MKKTIVLGASNNPSRYSYTAVERLSAYKHQAIPIGIKKGKINEIEIVNGQPPINDVHTISLYLNPQRQKEYYSYILSLAPKRIIFNPGTENIELINLAKQNNIEVEIACTLVMLSVGSY